MASFAQAGVQMVVKDLGKFKNDIGSADKSIGGFAKNAAGAAGKMALGIGAAAATTAVAIGGISLKAAIDFESAWTGVVKTTDGLVDEFGNLTDAGQELQDGFREMSQEVPTAIEELLSIGEIGGQLGIAQEDLLEFTRTVVDLGETTNLSTEEAAIGFARIGAVMGTTADEFSNMGSAVVELGNNFETNEREVLNFAERIAGAGNIAGLTEPNIFAIGAAMSSVGVQAEAGGTAVQKVLLAMNQAAIEGGDQMEIFAAVSGLSADEFGVAWEEDAGAVFTDFVEGLGMAGDDAIGILSALGMEDQRLIRSFLSLAGAGDKLGDAMSKADAAFESNTALTKEAELRYATTAAQFDIFKNSLKDIAITIGQALLPMFNKAIKGAQMFLKILKGVLSGKGVEMTEFKKEFGEGLPNAMLKVSRFIKNELIPAAKKIFEWLKVNIPIAIQTASDFWTNTLWPALQRVSDFITGTVIPIVQRIFGFFQNEGPSAMGATTGFIQGTLIPAFEKIRAFITETVIPAIEGLIEFFNTNFAPMIQEGIDFVLGEFQKFADWFEEIRPLIEDALNEISEFIQSILTTIGNFWNTHGETILGIIDRVFQQAKNIVESVMEIVRNVIELILNIITGNWDEVWNNIKTIVETVWNLILTQIETIINTVKDIIGIILGEININWEEVWNSIKTFVETLWTDIKTWIETAFNDIKTFLSETLTGIKTFWETTWGDIKTFVETLWTDIQTWIETAISDIQTTIETIMGDIKTTWETLWGDVKKAVEDKWNEIVTLVGEKIGEVLSKITGIIDDFKRAGKNIVNAIKDGFNEAWSGFIQGVKNKIGELTSLLPWNSPPADPAAELRGLEQAGRNIVDEMLKGALKEFPKLTGTFNAELSALTAMSPPVQTLGTRAIFPAGGGGARTQNNEFNATINNEMDARVFEQRVLRVVSQNIGE
jgi:TP901 family phage tail tape measure protein